MHAVYMHAHGHIAACNGRVHALGYHAILHYQEPVTVELGTTYCYRRSGPKRLLMERSETFQYIPLIPNLQWLLQNTDVYEEVS